MNIKPETSNLKYETLKILLVGGGHAMLPVLQAARGWAEVGAEAGADVTLINDHPFLYYSGMVPEYVGGVYRQDEVRIDLRALCARSDVRFVQATAVRLDVEARALHTEDGQRFAYDLAAFDIGARNSGDVDGAIQTKPLYHIEALVDRAEAVLSGHEAALRVVVAGGGAAGVEVALNLSGRFMGAGRKEALRLHVAEPGGRLLRQFPEGMSRRAALLLERRGAHLHVGTKVASVSEGRVTLASGLELEADAVLWATGSTAPPLFREAGLPCDERGFVRVGRALDVREHPRLFAAGDGALVAGHEDLARIGVHAVKQGPVLRDNLGAALRALRQKIPLAEAGLRPFSPYPVAPLLVSTGAAEAMWTSGNVWAHGRPLLRLKHLVDGRWMRKYASSWKGTPLWQMLGAGHAAARQDASVSSRASANRPRPARCPRPQRPPTR